MFLIPPPAPGATPVPNAYKAILRSLMPFVEGAVVAVVAHFGWHINLATAAQVLVVVGGALTVVLHAAESRWPWVGVFLGVLGAPAYVPSAKATQAGVLATQDARIATLEAELAAVYAAARAAAPATGTAAVAPHPAPPV